MLAIHYGNYSNFMKLFIIHLIQSKIFTLVQTTYVTVFRQTNYVKLYNNFRVYATSLFSTASYLTKTNFKV